jgi:hypothetical protein
MKTIYLDQNKWIELASCYYKKTSSIDIQNLLKSIKNELDRDNIILPLSAIHYMETSRIGNIERRERLGSFMYEFSKGYTIAFYTEILIHELEIALFKRFYQVSIRPFTLISKGILHAFGESLLTKTTTKMLWDGKKIIKSAKAIGYLEIEKNLLTGTGPYDSHAMPFRNNTYKRNFMEHQKKLQKENLAKLSPQRLDDILCGLSLCDIVEPINEILNFNNIDPKALFLQGKLGLKEILREIPTRQVDMHLHKQIIKNPSLKPKPSDLEDWAGLGPASMYCDVLICEKQFADLIVRDNFQTKAKVLTDLTKLPLVL